MRICSSHFVIFVTQRGRTYKGRCPKGTGKRRCIATTRKRFDTSSIPLTYIEFTRDSPPQVVSHGKVDPLNEVEVFIRR